MFACSHNKWRSFSDGIGSCLGLAGRIAALLICQYAKDSSGFRIDRVHFQHRVCGDRRSGRSDAAAQFNLFNLQIGECLSRLPPK